MIRSSTSVDQFHLGQLVQAIDDGLIGIPEFQRDFDWGAGDMRSLLATVFSGWPAGSLLLLEGEASFFQLRQMEGASQLTNVEFAVLDGQQRLTSLYQALFGKGGTIFAIDWGIAGAEDDIEEAIVFYRKRVWERQFGTLARQLENCLIPVCCLKTPSHFFEWRDDILSLIEDDVERGRVKNRITEIYTYRLSAIHDYQFPVVKLSRKVEAGAIARIFEKVNRTGLTLNTFDLMVAKSFDTGWNLRDQWASLKEDFPALARFFGEDGLPILQAIALIARSDLRQSSVLELSKGQVQAHWRGCGEAAFRVVEFLRNRCGVARRDFVPYLNLLPPLIALEAEGLILRNVELFERWFWASGFGGIYDVGANTRLVAHYKVFRGGRDLDYDQLRMKFFPIASANRKNNRALWTAVNCAILKTVEDSGDKLSEQILDEIEVAQLYSIDEVDLTIPFDDWDYVEAEYRSALNSVLVPRRFLSTARKLGALDTARLMGDTEFAPIFKLQVQHTGLDELEDWSDARGGRERWIRNFVRAKTPNLWASDLTGETDLD